MLLVDCAGEQAIRSSHDLIDTAEVIDGVPFTNLDEVILWKTAMGREKDLNDLELIANYRNKQERLANI